MPYLESLEHLPNVLLFFMEENIIYSFSNSITTRYTFILSYKCVKIRLFFILNLKLHIFLSEIRQKAYDL